MPLDLSPATPSLRTSIATPATQHHPHNRKASSRCSCWTLSRTRAHSYSCGGRPLLELCRLQPQACAITTSNESRGLAQHVSAAALPLLQCFLARPPGEALPAYPQAGRSCARALLSAAADYPQARRSERLRSLVVLVGLMSPIPLHPPLPRFHARTRPRDSRIPASGSHHDQRFSPRRLLPCCTGL